MRMDFSEITESDIGDIADSDAILGRGKRFYREGRVRQINLDRKKKEINAVVRGDTGIYDVKIRIENDGSGEEDDYIDAECSCPYGYGCKHIVATLYKWIELNGGASNSVKQIKSGRVEKDFVKRMLQQIKDRSEKEKILNAYEIVKAGKAEIKAINKRDIIAEVDDIKKERVNFSEFEMYCSCDNGWSRETCVHEIAAVIAVLRKRDKTAFRGLEAWIEKIRGEIRKQKYEHLTRSLETLENKREKDERKYEIFFCAERERDKIVISIKKAMILKNGGFRKLSSVSEYFLENHALVMSGEKRSAIDFLLSIPSESWRPETSIRLNKNSGDIFDFELMKKLRELYKKEPECFFECAFPSAEIFPNIQISKKDGESNVFAIRLYAEAGGKSFDLSAAVIAGKNQLWACAYDAQERKNVLFELKTKHPDAVKAIAEHGAEIPKAQMKSFIENYYMKLSSAGNVILPEHHKIEERTASPKPRLFLKDYENIFQMELRFLYGTQEAAHGTSHDIIFREKEKLVKIKRDKPEEERFYSALLENQTAEKGGILVPAINPYDWLADTAKNLILQGFEIFGADKLFNQKVAQIDPKLEIEISSGIDWFDLKGAIKCGKEELPLESLFGALNNQERFVKLSDGRLCAIPKKWIQNLAGVAGFLDYDKKQGKAKASNSQIAIIEALLGIADASKIDDAYDSIRKKFRKFKEIKNMPLPKGLKGELRNYQKAGYEWLHFLKEFSFGGCLADEMGLGKTLQVLALLAYEKERGAAQSLIVVPTSLVFNWVAEAAKFTPNLKVYVHHGLSRKTSWKEIGEECDLIVTTYGTLRNDIELFRKKEFHYIVLDESQQIKNPFSKNAKSAYSLKSKHRLALTGTPIENNSLELWSQFAFLNPGLLGNMDYFKENFAKNIEKDGNRMSSLKNIINPFLLRRKKETVAKELPEKQITVLYCDMTDSQRKAYEFWKEKYRRDIESSIREKGFLQSRFKILEGLVKLRQICNHPALVDESYAEESGKFNALLEQIEEAVGEGHKVLVFSSFVKMLKVFRKYFDKEGIKYSYLDGSTRNRKEIVEEFQNSKIPVFLISLKAGGLGLNLTAADYVFIVDPWWNPAAEMQAIDRTHRIGQKNSVFVYKAITKDSVEEKILELQKSKLDLVENVISANEGIFKKLDRETIEMMFK